MSKILGIILINIAICCFCGFTICIIRWIDAAGHTTPNSQKASTSRTALQELTPHLGPEENTNVLNVGDVLSLTQFQPDPSAKIDKAELQKNYKAAFDEIEALTKFLNTAEEKLTNIKTDFQTCLKNDEKQSTNEPSEEEIQEAKSIQEKIAKPKVVRIKSKASVQGKNFIKLNKTKSVKKVTPKKKVIAKPKTRPILKKTTPIENEAEINTTYDISKTPSIDSPHLLPESIESPIRESPKFYMPPKLTETSTSPIHFDDDNLDLVPPIEVLTIPSPQASIIVDFIEIGVQAQETPRLMPASFRDEALEVDIPKENDVVSDIGSNKAPMKKLSKLSVQKLPQIAIRSALTKQLAPTLVITPEESKALDNEKVANMKYLKCVLQDTNETNQKEIEEAPQIKKIEHDIQLIQEAAALSIISEGSSNESSKKSEKRSKSSKNSKSISIDEIKQRTLENTKLIKEKRKTLSDELNLKTENIPSINTLKAIQNYLETKRKLIHTDLINTNQNRCYENPSSQDSDTSPHSSLYYTPKPKTIVERSTKKMPTNSEIKTCFEASQLLLEKMKNLSFKTQPRPSTSTRKDSDEEDDQKRTDSEAEVEKVEDKIVEGGINAPEKDSQSQNSDSDAPLSNWSYDKEFSSSKSNDNSRTSSEDRPVQESLPKQIVKSNDASFDSYSDDFERDFQTGRTGSTLKTKENSPHFENKIKNNETTQGRSSAFKTKENSPRFESEKTRLDLIKNKDESVGDTLNASPLEQSPPKVQAEKVRLAAGDESNIVKNDPNDKSDKKVVKKIPIQETSIQTEHYDSDRKEIAKIAQQTEEMKKELMNLNILLKKINHEASVQTSDIEEKSEEKNKEIVQIEAKQSVHHLHFLLSDPMEISDEAHSKSLENKLSNDEIEMKNVIYCSPKCSPKVEPKENETVRRANSTFEETQYLNLPGTSRDTMYTMYTNETGSSIDRYDLHQYEFTNIDKTIPIYNLYVNPSYTTTPLPRVYERSPREVQTQSSISESDALSEGEIMLPCKCSTSIGETHLCKFANSIKTKVNNSAKYFPKKILVDSIGAKDIEIKSERRNLYTDNFVTYTYGYKNQTDTSESEPYSSGSEYTSSNS